MTPADTFGTDDRIARKPMLVTLMVASSISPLAINIFIPSMATIADALGTDGPTVGLGLSLYLVAVAVLQIVAGPLSDRFGRRPVIIGGMVLFLAGTALCLFAETIGWFLAGRIIQAASATGIALSRAIVRDVYSRQRSAAMIGYVTMGLAVAPMIGPAIGGFMDTLLGWRSVFWLLMALGIVTLAFVIVDLNETNPNLGAPFTRQLSGYGKLLSEPSFWIYAGAGSFITASFFGFLGGATFVSVELLGLSPAEYGIWFILCPLGYAIGNFVTGRISERVGIKRMMVMGSSLTLVSTLIVLVPILFGYLSALTLFGPMILLGIGNGMTLPSATAGGVSVRTEAAGAAAGLLGSSQIGLGAVASSIAAAFAVGPHAATSLALVMLVPAGIALVFSLVAPRVSEE
ncbi:multidrug effflux MFS transporter [Fulvimarina sp. 2208YS6-2-32]|uniref:Bcr/CflA family efflux transporter n=1 Tax=Fulvimarina uroteuthidis TaxID=3098149 RepID=A0ABU5I233_9HYPH|nr:multidrug effflux MFS transporter [Fulvimarina sp. 2208YS6-2-32]MDY8109425.1 multidrug effflux MFS transporter [Fulvimarina sp. 2208YS6-2-32]